MSQIMHVLKCWPDYFALVRSGQKKFEVRYNDRGFKTGDLLELRCLKHNQRGAAIDDRVPSLYFRVGHILQGGQFGLRAGYCVMSLSPLEPSDDISKFCHGGA